MSEAVQNMSTNMKTESKDVQSKSLWSHAWTALVRDRVALVSMVIVGTYALVALLTSVGIIAGDWNVEAGASYLPPSADHIFGTDIFGRSVWAKTLKGTEVAMMVGFCSALIATVIGLFFGSVAGYFG